MSAAVSTATTPGAARTGARSSAADARVRALRQPERGVQGAARLENVVDVDRFARDVKVGALVPERHADAAVRGQLRPDRKRLVHVGTLGNKGATPPCRASDSPLRVGTIAMS